MTIVSSGVGTALRMEELTYDNLFGTLIERSSSKLVFQLDADNRTVIGGSFGLSGPAQGAGLRMVVSGDGGDEAGDDPEPETDDEGSEDGDLPSWQLDGTEPAASGVVTAIEIYSDGELTFSASGFSVDFIVFWTGVMNGDPTVVTAAILAGNDVLQGGGNDDYLEAFGGHDWMDGGAGADVMVGGEGNDTYLVTQDDEVYEGAGEGIDTVLASSSFILDDDAHVEALRVLEGAVGVTLGGNREANAIAGASGADVLLGFAGADRLSGGDGSDLLDGGSGRDILKGGAGSDAFAFTTKPTKGAADVIADFSRADDRIHLENKIFKGLKAGNLSKKAFVAGLEPKDGNDRILYDRKSGTIWFDADGIGAKAAVQVATVKAGLALDASDFFVI